MFSSFTDLPRLGNYAEAVRHYENIAPIRGSDNVRPLCNTTTGRRKKYLSIHESVVLGCKAISCQLYSTDVLSFLEDGRVHIDSSYMSMSTNNFIKQILRGVSSIGFNSGRAWLSSNGKHWVMGQGLVLLPQDGGWVPETPHRAFRSLANKRAMSAMFKQYKPFIEHCKNVAKLMDAETVNQAYRGTGMITLKPPLDLATMANPDRSGWGDLTIAVLKHGVTMNYNWLPLAQTGGRWENLLKGEVAVRWLRRYLKEAHMHEVFQLEEIPLGTWVRDTNYKTTAKIMGVNRCV